MFTWICPQCGREVPPSYSECPACAENRQRAAQGLPPLGAEPVAVPPPAWQPPPPPSQPVQPPPAYYPPQQPATQYAPQQAPQYAPPPPPQPQYAAPPPQYAAPQQQQWQPSPAPPQPAYTLPEAPPRKGLPVWLVTILVAVVAVGVIFGAVRLFGSKSGSSGDASSSSAQSAAATDSSNPYAKYLEVTGVRIAEDEKQHAQAYFVVVNHSTADLPDLELQVTLTTTTAKAGDDPLAVVTVKTGPIPANGSKDVSSVLKTKLRAYEMPDWQFLKASFAIAGQH